MRSLFADPIVICYIANYAGSSVMRMSSTGTILWKSLISISAGPGHGGQFNPTGITTAKDGNIWVIGNYSVSGSYLIKLSPSGKILLRKPLDSKGLTSLISGSDDSLWYYSNAGSTVYRRSSSGVVTQFRIPPDEDPATLPNRYPTGGNTTGSGNYLWFVDRDNDRIGRVTSEFRQIKNSDK